VLVFLKNEVCEKALSRTRGVLRIDLDSDACKDRGFIPEERPVVFHHIAGFGDPPSGFVRARADHDGLDVDKRNPGGAVHRTGRRSAIPEIGDGFSVGEGEEDLGGLVIGGRFSEVAPLGQLGHLPFPGKHRVEQGVDVDGFLQGEGGLFAPEPQGREAAVLNDCAVGFALFFMKLPACRLAAVSEITGKVSHDDSFGSPGRGDNAKKEQKEHETFQTSHDHLRSQHETTTQFAWSVIGLRVIQLEQARPDKEPVFNGQVYSINLARIDVKA